MKTQFPTSTIGSHVITHVNRWIVFGVCALSILLSFVLTPTSLIVNSRVKAGTVKLKAPAPRTDHHVPTERSAVPIHQEPDTPHTVAASFYSTQGYNAVLLVTNQGPDPMLVNPLLFNSLGERLEISPVTLEGNQVYTFNLNELAARGGPSFKQGSVQLKYDGHFVELGGALQMIDEAHSFIFDEELTEPARMFASSRLEGTWWLPSRQADLQLAISNSTDAAVSATITADGEMPKATKSENVVLGPHELRLIDVRTFIAAAGDVLSRIGGISIHHNGKPGALLARGFIKERGTGFSSVVEFYDPRKARTSALHGAGLRLDAIGGEDLIQVGVARNIGTTDTVVTGRIPVTTADNQIVKFDLSPTRLAPGETKELNLTPAINRRLRARLVSAGLEFNYTGDPGTVIASALSMSKSGNQVFRVPMLDPKAQVSSTGRYPWSIEGGSSTLAYVKNVTGEKQRYFLQIDFPGGVYVAGIKTVEAGQTAVFDVRTIRDKQLPDEQGHTIPLTATHGKITWSVLGPGNFVLLGRAEQVDAMRGLSSTNACGSCCPIGYANSFCDPPGVEGLPQASTRFRAFQSNADCHGNFYAPFLVTPEFWSSSDPSIASVDGTGFATALSFGSTGIQASWTAYNFAHGGPEVCDVNPEDCDNCIETAVTAVADAFCDVAGIRGRVVSPPVSNDGDAVIAGQQFTLEAEIITPAGVRARSFSGNAALAFEGFGQIQGENLPTGVTLTEGAGTTTVNLRAVTATGRPGRNYELTFTDGAGTTHFSGLVKVYFSIRMDVERWKNCGFVSCPNLGSYFCTTACQQGGFSQQTKFVALTASTCDTSLIIINGQNSEVAQVKDVGPQTNNSYWTTGNFPTIGGCITDVLADALGVQNGCNPGPFGQANILWRFQ